MNEERRVYGYALPAQKECDIPGPPLLQFRADRGGALGEDFSPGYISISISPQRV